VAVLALLLETKQAVLAIRPMLARHKGIMVATLLTLLILHRQTETHTLVAVVAGQAALALQALRQT
jgi:hypothetical protein